VVALGQLAFKAYLDFLARRGSELGRVKFSHGARVQVQGMPWLYGSYHPSPRNTYTGKLTDDMLVEIFEKAKTDWKR
jgi:uracil-DNA glycosylase